MGTSHWTIHAGTARTHNTLFQRVQPLLVRLKFGSNVSFWKFCRTRILEKVGFKYISVNNYWPHCSYSFCNCRSLVRMEHTSLSVCKSQTPPSLLEWETTKQQMQFCKWFNVTQSTAGFLSRSQQAWEQRWSPHCYWMWTHRCVMVPALAWIMDKLLGLE